MKMDKHLTGSKSPVFKASEKFNKGLLNPGK